MTPDGKVAAEAFGVIREAMAQAGKVALGRVVMDNHERVLALEPRGNDILATTLRTRDEVRDVAAIFDQAPTAASGDDMVAIAQKVIAQKVGKFDPAKFVDRYETALRTLIEQKSKGRRIVAAAAPEATNVIDLMDALKKSLGDAARSAPKRATASSIKSKPAKAAPRKRKPGS